MAKAIVLALGIFVGTAGLTASNPSAAEPLVPPTPAADEQGTARFVSGTITGIEGNKITITPFSGSRPTDGKVEPGRTRILVNGRAGQVGDLQHGFFGRAEISFDEVWLSIHVTAKR